MKTNIKLFKFDELKNIEGVDTIVQLMMVVNDLIFSNECLGGYKEDFYSKNADRDRGGAMYCLRVQLSHFYEALEIINKIHKDNGSLKKYLLNCSITGRNEFKELMSCRKDGYLSKTEEYLRKIRNILTFHYKYISNANSPLIGKYIDIRSESNVGNYSKIERSNHISRKYYKISDDIIDSIFCREILNIDFACKDVQKEVDIILTEINKFCLKLLGFAEEYIFVALGR